MSYHSGTGGNNLLNPIVDGTKINGLWMEYVEDSLDAVAASGAGVLPHTYIIRENGADYEAWSSTGLTYGGASDAGGIDGALFADVLNTCITDGGRTFIKNGTYSLAASIVPKTDAEVIGESMTGVVITWSGAVGSSMVSQASTTQVTGFVLANVTLDVDDTATSNGMLLDTMKESSFRNILIKNASDGTAIIIQATGGVALPNGASNFYSCDFDNIVILDAEQGITLTGSQASVEITLVNFNKVRMERITSKGIAFKGWASGTMWFNTWIWLSAAGSIGVVWNDSATPLVNVGDYDNSFVNLKVDPFGLADNAATTLLKFNCTKEDYIYGFFHSGATTFLGTVLDDDATTVSYYIVQSDASYKERAATQDSYIRVLSKGMMHGTHIVDDLHIYGDAAGSGAYLVLNDLYEATNSVIYLRTNDGGNKQAIISMLAADGNLRINASTGAHILMQLGDAAGADYLSIRDSADAEVSKVDSNGNFWASGYIKSSDTYYSSDNSPGATTEVEYDSDGAGTMRHMVIKDGLFIETHADH